MNPQDTSFLQESEAKRRVDALFVDDKVRGRVVDLIVRNKPVGWSRRSQATYFKPGYGVMMKEVLDIMMNTKQDTVFSLARFPGKKLETIYLMVNQSIRYVVEKLDNEECKYARFLEMIGVHKERGVGVRISLSPEHRDKELMDFKPVFVDPKCEVPLWKEQLEKWIDESEPGDAPLLLEKLVLSSDEIKELKISFSQLKNIMSNVTAHSIKAVKLATPL